MSIEKTWQTNSASLEQTEALGAEFGRHLRGGEVIELISDLGGGKTAFVRGLARGMGSTDAVASPSFTISREYKANDLTLYHFDFYRLADPGIIANELAEIITDPKAVVAVEWGEIVEDVLPKARVEIKIIATDETSRNFEISYDDALSYLIPKDSADVDSDN